MTGRRGDTMEGTHAPSTLLAMEDVTVQRGGVSVVHDVNLTVQSGEFVGIVGPNGGGKSTLLQAVLGVLRCHKGTVKVFDHPPMSSRVLGKVAWVSQAAANLPSNVRLTVRELVQLGLLNQRTWFRPFSRDDGTVDRAIAMVGLDDLADSDVGHLSGGQRQRAVIARALATKAEVLLLDEPLVGMDLASRNALLKLLDGFCHNEGKTIVMVSHDMTAIRQSAHRIVYLEGTVRFDGAPPDFPSLEALAELRGIDDVHGGHHHDHGEEHCGHDHAVRDDVVDKEAL